MGKEWLPLLLAHLQGAPCTLQALGRAAQGTLQADMVHLEHEADGEPLVQWGSL